MSNYALIVAAVGAVALYAAWREYAGNNRRDGLLIAALGVIVIHRCPRCHSAGDSGSESFALLRHVTRPDISIQHPDWHPAIRLCGSPFLAVNKH